MKESRLLFVAREKLGSPDKRTVHPNRASWLERGQRSNQASVAILRGHYYRRGAHYVDKILKGANPGELPIEGPAKFDFVVNLKTANALGIEIPKSILLQAISVIE